MQIRSTDWWHQFVFWYIFNTSELNSDSAFHVSFVFALCYRTHKIHNMCAWDGILKTSDLFYFVRGNLNTIQCDSVFHLLVSLRQFREENPHSLSHTRPGIERFQIWVDAKLSGDSIRLLCVCPCVCVREKESETLLFDVDLQPSNQKPPQSWTSSPLPHFYLL